MNQFNVFVSDACQLNSDLRESVISTFSHAFPDASQNRQVLAHLNGNISRICFIQEQREIISALFFQRRNFNLGDVSSSLFSVGPIATQLSYRGKGLATSLLSKLDEIAILEDIEIIILSGIPQFYLKLGYYPCYQKSKVTISKEDISSYLNQDLIDSFSITNTKKYKLSKPSQLFYITRTKSEWDWLEKIGSASYYFPNPTSLSDQNYKESQSNYCTYEINNNILLVREEVVNDLPSFGSLLNLLKLKTDQYSSVEIHSSQDSFLFNNLSTTLPFTFSAYPHPTARGLMKIVNPDSLFNCISRVGKSNPASHYLETIIDFYRKLDRNQTISFFCTNFNVKDYLLPGLLTGHWDLRILSSRYLYPFDFSNISYLDYRKTFLLQGDSM